MDAIQVSCQEVQQALLLAEQVGEAGLDRALADHLEQCATCRTFQEELVLIDQLVVEQAPELPQGFELDLQRRLSASKGQAAATPSHTAAEKKTAQAVSPRRWLRWAAAAAVLLVCGGALWAALRWSSSPQPAPSYHRLRLAVTTARACAAASFSVELPAGVQPLPGTAALLGKGPRLVWRSELRPGTNTFDLPLAVLGKPAALTVQMKAGDISLRQRILFKGDRQADAVQQHEGLRLALRLATASLPDGEQRFDREGNTRGGR